MVALGIGGYLLGSVPFGVVASRCLGAADPRTAGSRNIGFTNVLRISGKTAGLLTLAGDMGKGWIVGWLAHWSASDEVTALALAGTPIAGHLFPIFLGFRGGKGVATALGSLAGVAPMLGLAVMAVWLGAVGLSRYSSGGALAAFTLAPLLAWGFGKSGSFIAFTILLAALIWWKHADNVVRLLNGTERRIGSPA
jgi:glycerol-3-phosphate acyltransferase PlsY